MLPFLILISTIEKYYSTSIETAEQYNDTYVNILFQLLLTFYSN